MHDLNHHAGPRPSCMTMTIMHDYDHRASTTIVHDYNHHAQHMDPLHLQVDYPEGTEFDASDTSVYFVKSGQVQLKAADKQLEDREVMQTVAQAAVAVQTMAASGPLSKVDSPFPRLPPPPPPPPCFPTPPSSLMLARGIP